MGDKSGVALSFGQLDRLAEEKGNYEEAVINYLLAFEIFKELKSPYMNLASKDLSRIEKKLGKDRFEELLKKILDSFK